MQDSADFILIRPVLRRHAIELSTAGIHLFMKCWFVPLCITCVLHAPHDRNGLILAAHCYYASQHYYVCFHLTENQFYSRAQSLVSLSLNDQAQLQQSAIVVMSTAHVCVLRFCL